MKDLDLFKPLNESEKELVTTLAIAKSFHKGEPVFLENEPADTIYLIKSGKILLYKLSEDGKEIALDILHENDIFGENTLFEDANHTMNAKAMENTFVCTCSRRDLPELLKNPAISFKIIKVLGDKLNNYTEQMAMMAFQDVKGRILKTMIRLSKDYGEQTSKGIKINVPLNHQDIANLVNASRVMVTNSLKDLREEELLMVDQRQFYLLDQSLPKKSDTYSLK